MWEEKLHSNFGASQGGPLNSRAHCWPGSDRSYFSVHTYLKQSRFIFVLFIFLCLTANDGNIKRYLFVCLNNFYLIIYFFFYFFPTRHSTIPVVSPKRRTAKIFNLPESDHNFYWELHFAFQPSERFKFVCESSWNDWPAVEPASFISGALNTIVFLFSLIRNDNT